MNLPQIGDWADFDGLARLQRDRLPAVLAAAERSPFYRKRGVGPLEEQPLTTKQDLRDAYPFGMLAADRADLATYHESSGSTGDATASYYTEADWVDLAECFARKWTGITAADTMLVRTPYALMITGHLAHAAARRHGATVVPADNRSLATPYSRVVRLLHDLGVTLTWSLPTDALLWAAAARIAGYRDFPALRALFVGGEPVGPARKARIARIWGAPVVEEYGATETGSLAGECEHGTMHLWADRAIFEVQDPATGELSPQGRGRLVVTPLFREAMPLLRYAIEDEAEVSYRECPCGWHLPAVRILGRSAFAAGELTQLGLEDLVFGLPDDFGVWFWRARADGDRLRVEIEVADRWRSAAVHTLGAAVRAAHPAVETTVVPVPPGGLVPFRMLTAQAEVMKPRGLFGPGEDWDAALQYY
ncbi:phenylacetate--CoA ligase family protein [Dactylosporangium salmoneum]|uniref:AMP-dependent synthetase/ligase domain-containing protein n=1 Tax=Dactylosporangium salmoneum TaxID=53361 RepID=A0ABN3FTE4_9ACTN